MDASHLPEELPCATMATKGRRSIGSYLTVTKVFQDDIRDRLAENEEALAKNKELQRSPSPPPTNYKTLAASIGHNASSISLIMAPGYVGKTSRLCMKISECLRIPLPVTEAQEDARMLEVIRADNPRRYKKVHDLIADIYEGSTKRPLK